MKVAMRLTLQGLVRALRSTAHQAADAVESGAWESPAARERRATLRQKNLARRRRANDRGRA